MAMAMANNTSNGNNANNTNNAHATNNANPPGKQTPAAKDSSKEEELEEMLYRLDQAHAQLRRLRSALPRMLEPLKTKHPSPQAAFEAYMQSVDRTNKEVSGFQSTLSALQTDGVFAKATLSRKENPKGLKQWRAAEHPEWADSAAKRRRIS